ncbi:MAG: histidine kinase [Lachnospiraceae bacterium]|nr:histidine kinase [Lachnospiraceae bacterium]
MLRKYKNLSLFSKISFVMCGLALALSSIITLTAIIYYRYIFSERLLGSVKTATVSAANTLYVNYTDIIERFVLTCGTEDFKSDVEYLYQSDNSYLTAKGMVQDELAALSNCNYLVHGAMILSGDGKTAYTLYNNPLYETAEEMFSSIELSQVKGISFLKERKSPFRSRVSVIPIVFPVSVITQYVELDISDSAPNAYVIIFIDSSKMQTCLNLTNVSQAENVYYLLTADGCLLNSPSAEETDDVSSILEDNRTKELLSSVTWNTSDCSTFVNSDCYLAAYGLRYGDMILLNYVPRETLPDIFGKTGYTLLLLLMLLVFFLLTIAFLMAHYITRPVNRLVEVVHQIEENRYTEKLNFSANDEIGQLGSAINTMHDTIRQQMVRIKQEEAEKYKTQIQLLTEQINPHFLYNTLECIQSEVLRGNSSTATNMIQYLAEYLRIGLSYGADLITISNELRHADVYIKLMNQRFQQSIIFLYKPSSDLNQRLIPKTILQPLVENSIRHGFGIDASGIPISVPTIEINFYAVENRLSIEVIDNGCGFDVKKVEAITLGNHPGDSSGHVGLHNIYHRLVTYYGKENVQVAFNSIPYYRNEILISIPLSEE